MPFNRKEGGAIGQVKTSDGKTITMWVDPGLHGRDIPKEEEVQRALSTLADLWERSPDGTHSPPSIQVVDPQTAPRDYEVSVATEAFVVFDRGRPATIYFVGARGFRPSKRKGKTYQFHGSTVEGTVAHEYGHLHDLWGGTYLPSGRIRKNRKGMYRAIQEWAPKNGGMSRYGMTNEYEAYAEAYAEWMMTQGNTKVPAVLAYAEAYEWPRGGGAARALLEAGAPEPSRARVLQQAISSGVVQVGDRYQANGWRGEDLGEFDTFAEAVDAVEKNVDENNDFGAIIERMRGRPLEQAVEVPA